MRTRILGKNGPELTEIGLGAWAIGGPWQYGWGPQDDKDSLRTIHKALELGINWIDTAAVYGLGHSEKVVGEAVKDRRDKVFIATKCGLTWNKKGNVKGNINPDSIRKECEASLKRLQTDYLDLYQIHWPDGKTPVEDAWEMMLMLKEEGKVRYVGVSNFDSEQLAKCMEKGNVQSLQPPYAMLRRKIEQDQLPYCREHQIGIIAYSPMMSGLLTGKFDLNRLAEDDWRRGFWSFKEPFYSKALTFIEKMKPIAAKYGLSPAQFSIAWVLQQKGITAAIVGARTESQIAEIVGAADQTIETVDLNYLDSEMGKILGDKVYNP